MGKKSRSISSTSPPHCRTDCVQAAYSCVECFDVTLLNSDDYSLSGKHKTFSICLCAFANVLRVAVQWAAQTDPQRIEPEDVYRQMKAKEERGNMKGHSTNHIRADLNETWSKIWNILQMRSKTNVYRLWSPWDCDQADESCRGFFREVCFILAVKIHTRNQQKYLQCCFIRRIDLPMWYWASLFGSLCICSVNPFILIFPFRVIFINYNLFFDTNCCSFHPEMSPVC